MRHGPLTHATHDPMWTCHRSAVYNGRDHKSNRSEKKTHHLAFPYSLFLPTSGLMSIPASGFGTSHSCYHTTSLEGSKAAPSLHSSEPRSQSPQYDLPQDYFLNSSYHLPWSEVLSVTLIYIPSRRPTEAQMPFVILNTCNPPL